MKLTRQQQGLSKYLRNHADQFPYWPADEELCHTLGLRSRRSFQKQINALVSVVLVEPMAGRQGIRRVELERNVLHLPHLGAIAAGRPIEAVAQPEFLPVPECLTSQSKCYVLTVKGESMIEAGIMDGDLVVIEERATARNGEIVVALINNEEATLKRLQNNDDGSITLLPENRTMAPMNYVAGQVQIQGVLISLLRRY